MDEHKSISTLFRKFIDNQCTPTEIDEIIQYLKSSEYNTDDLPEIEEVKARLSSLPALDPRTSERVFNTIVSKENREVVPIAKERLRFKWWQVAAVFTGLMLLTGIGLLLFYNQPMVEYTTNFNETETIQLPDGSVVTLNANSSLRLMENWKPSEPREVWLKGEAFFSVNHLPSDQKFVVYTSQNFNVEVLGTAFNVNDRGESTKVVLNSGQVKVRAGVSADARELLMKPGEMVEYKKYNQELTQKTVDTTLYTSWRNNLLLFDDTPLKEVAQVIEDNFGYRVQFEDVEIAELRFTGSNPADDLKLLLNTLSKSFNLKITRNEEVIHIAHEKRNPPAEDSISMKQVGKS